jgi:hypothetical protein
MSFSYVTFRYQGYTSDKIIKNGEMCSPDTVVIYLSSFPYHAADGGEVGIAQPT